MKIRYDILKELEERVTNLEREVERIKNCEWHK